MYNKLKKSWNIVFSCSLLFLLPLLFAPCSLLFVLLQPNYSRLGKNFKPVFGDKEIIFQTAAAMHRVVQTRLNRKDHPRLQIPGYFTAASEKGTLMHVQPDAVPQSVYQAFS